jgi:1-acyl-sn-glycerol-3-phosphate acyltransferase
MTAWFGTFVSNRSEPWLWGVGLGLVIAGHAIYSPARYAMLPVAAQVSRSPLSRVIGLIEMGHAAGMVAGLLLGRCLHDVSWPDVWAVLGRESNLASTARNWHFPVPVAAAMGLDLIAAMGALPAHFASDVRRPESPARAMAGFFQDSKLILKDRPARQCLLGLAFFGGLIAASACALLGPIFEGGTAGKRALLLAGLGAAAGCLLAGLQVHPRRVLGLVPPAALGLLTALAWAATSSKGPWISLLLGLVGCFLIVPFRASFQFALPVEKLGNGMALAEAANGLTLCLVWLLLWIVIQIGLPPPGCLWVLAILAAAGGLLAWRVFLREAIEQLGEIVLWPMYRVRARGPGCSLIPLRGPLLVIANHAAWFDPLWLAKVLPRCVTPMMTSAFFDLPILHWLMSKVAGAIRVPAPAFRREAPELQEAVNALDRGDCVLIFPEGAMKRSSERSLRQFGQGVWQILRQRPQTPVVVCWIEGGWGSFTSYSGGQPAVNKHLDWRRPIEIVLEAPQVLDTSLLADQRASRTYLMNACLNARRHLGLQPLPLQPGACAPLEAKSQYEQA